MSEPKQALPSIAQFLGIMPEIEISVPAPAVHSPPAYAVEEKDPGFQFPKVDDSKASHEVRKGRQNVKTVFFTPAEDLALFKTIFAYYGSKPIVKVPWSFWDLYRRTTGSDRSDSSLYHHWNGSIVKKYGKLLKEGRIHECIQLAEAVTEKQTPAETTGSKLQYSASAGAYGTVFACPQYYYPSYQPSFDTQVFQNQRQLVHFRSLPVFNVIPPQ